MQPLSSGVSRHDISADTVPNTVLIIVLAIATGAAAIGILYARWRKWTKFRGVLVVVSGALATVSLILWIEIGGPEYGSAYAVLNIVIAAWFFVLANVELRRNKGQQQARTAAGFPDIRAMAHHVAIFLVAVPLAAIASTLISIAVSSLLPWNDIDRSVFPLFAMPVLWGCVAFWSCADPKLWRPALGLIAFGGFSAAALFI